MIEILEAIHSNPFYIVASAVALLAWIGVFTAFVAVECKEHLRWY